MMRPENSHNRDVVDMLLEKSWEAPPIHLEQKLMSIPAEIAPVLGRSIDRFAFLLNTILFFWGLSLAIFFWTTIEAMILSFSNSIRGLGTLFPEILAQPIVGLITLVCLLAGGVWMDMEKHPGNFN